MKHIHTFESFLNESEVKDPKLIKGADITIEMDDEDGDFSAGDYRVTGLTRGGVILDGMGKRNLQVSFGALNDAGYTINENFLNETLFEPKGEGHKYEVKHKVGDEIILPSLGKCKVEEINFKPKKVYKNPFQSISKDFDTFEIVKAFSKTTHTPQSIGNNAIRLVNKFGDSILMYQYESGGKIYTQYAFME